MELLITLACVIADGKDGCKYFNLYVFKLQTSFIYMNSTFSIYFDSYIYY